MTVNARDAKQNRRRVLRNGQLPLNLFAFAIRSQNGKHEKLARGA